MNLCLLHLLFVCGFISTNTTDEYSNALPVLMQEDCKRTSICLQKIKPLSTLCQNSESSESQSIACAESRKIQITHVAFKNGKNNKGCDSCSSNDLKSLNVEGGDLDTIKHTIYQTCSYQSSCLLTSIHTPKLHKDVNIWKIDISYCCVPTAKINDACAESNQTLLEEPMHFVHMPSIDPQESNTYNQSCECTIHGDVNIDFIEYSHMNCPSTSHVHVNDNEELEACSSQCNVTCTDDRRVRDKSVSITGVLNNVKFWYSVTNRSSEIMTITCNKGNGSFTKTTGRTSTPSTMTSVTSTEGTLLTSSSMASGTTYANFTSKAENLSLNSDDQPPRNEFPTAAVIGGVVSSIVVICAIVAAVVFIRSRSTKVKPNTTFSGLSNDESRHVGEMVNNAYEDAPGESSTNPMQNSIERNTFDPESTTYEYADISSDRNEPVIYAKVNKPKPTVVASSQFAGESDETYATTSDNSKPTEDKSTYNTFPESDEYSHIHSPSKNNKAPMLDTYSHLPLPSDKETPTEFHEGSDYNHITLNAKDRGPNVYTQDLDTYYNTDM